MDVGALLANGWRPTPFTQFILKIHSRCDLACTYCYVYEMADQSWRSRPKRMSLETVKAASARITEHVLAHDLRHVQVILHGGEPLLAGARHIAEIVDRMRTDVPVSVEILVQTNATLLDEEFLRALDECDVGVGVSLDGAEPDNDRARRTKDGRGSYRKVAAALERLGSPEWRRLFRGILCAVDLRNDPLETFAALRRFDPPAIDFLLPHGNWTNPPPGRTEGSPATPYADWLLTVFDNWTGEPRIRLFDEIIRLVVGGRSRTEQVGLSPAAMVVIETDGSIEQSDILKSAYDGAAWTGLHVDRDPFDRLLLHPMTAARQIGAAALAPECVNCPIGQTCGGGMFAHRFRSGSGFLNPSVYCPDLLRLIGHIGDVVRAALKERP
ncbi:FxsB family radical SAM/SPASM domain protein [Streptosporangiaceae bacterium NEAU-GS5]|nr:FxsB family radical SAM/SPASM domain protein [Streptosporangiaceae bacterium NEAU-GS5]